MRKEKFMVGDIVRLKNKELKLKIDSMNDDGTSGTRYKVQKFHRNRKMAV